MSAVNVTNVTVLDNPSMFQNPFQFEISYECLVPLKDDLEWKLIYVGSAEDEKYDQVLESVLVGPVNVGNYRFVFQADPPEPSKIPEEGDDPSFRLAAHPGGEGVLCSFESDCRLFQVRRADGGEVTVRAAEREIPALQGIGEQRYPKPASCTSSQADHSAKIQSYVVL